ncbi:MAG: hypothetical protein ACO1OG_04110 [Devosia sp.]
MSAAIALIGAFLSFIVPLRIPLFAQRWTTLGITVAIGAVFFVWVNMDLASPTGITNALGPFLFGLMLFGFAGGVIAKFVMLLSRR